jgi:hypothetical protein
MTKILIIKFLPKTRPFLDEIAKITIALRSSLNYLSNDVPHITPSHFKNSMG